MNFDKLRENIKELIQNEEYYSLSFLDETIIKFNKYYEFLVEENKKYNLTAIVDKEDVILKHFYDSILLLKYKNLSNLRVADIGTGAGFPGIPLLICNPTIKLTLIEPTSKKCEFLTQLTKLLDLHNVQIINERAENLNRKIRDSFDVIVSRAVSSLRVLSELCIPYLKIRGEFIAYKSAIYEDEIKDSSNAFKVLNCKLEKVEEEKLIDNDNLRVFVFITKTKKTEFKYPRNYSIIKSKPL